MPLEYFDCRIFIIFFKACNNYLITIMDLLRCQTISLRVI